MLCLDGVNVTSCSSSNVTSLTSGTDLEVYVIKVIIALLITFLINVLNIVNLIILRRMVSINNTVKNLMISMSVSDLLLGIFVCLPGIISALLHFWPFASIFCQITGFINGMSIGVSSWCMTCISIERYLVVVRPLGLQYRQRSWILRLILALIWTTNSATFVLPMLVNEEWTYYKYDDVTFMCGFEWDPYWMIYVALLVYQLCPAVVSSICSVGIIHSLRINLRVAPSTSRETPPLESSLDTLRNSDIMEVQSEGLANVKTIRHNAPIIQPRNILVELKLKKEAKVTKVLMLTQTAFFICTMPYVITSMVQVTQSIVITSFNMFIISWFLNCNSFINVFIYSLTYQEFRTIFKTFKLVQQIRNVLRRH
ncbi:G-protein coupled receptor 21 [Biomphalaria glabrata]|uniref:G-protein coupled receptors family 1 profile domain-containing protein n=1 Tax=Biomphalaria glabrata TaxID=6526 RepID=A0A2C9L3Y0_BIOGL|nr:putative G-protein coupled receptor 21 [Biomphalaria glabrata]KAI8793885.1 G-protein coupled receptor 21 [Biomphalaria glabrata]